MERTTKQRAIATGGGLLALLALSAAPASAQEGSWVAWLGCWESLDEAGTVLCVVPDAREGGVEMLTAVDGEVTGRQLLVADGRERAFGVEGCEGTRSARFSEDGARVFVESVQLCEGGTRRAGSGILAMVGPDEWIDVQAVRVGDRDLALVQRYRPAPDAVYTELGVADPTAGRGLAVRSARMAAVAAVDVDAVLEADAAVSPVAVEAWIAEQREGFDLSSRELIRMAEAGVSDEVIDLVVAVSYPGHFAVATGAEGRDDPYGAWGYGGYRGGYYDDLWYDRYHYGSRYGSRFGYSPWGYGSYYGYQPRVIVVQPRQDDSPPGRAVPGRGYTRGGTADRAGGSRASDPPTASKGSSASGSTGTSTGRKAKRRGGGGGDGEGGETFELRLR